MGRVKRMIAMLVRENLSRGSLERTPEELLVMDAPDQVDAWHAQGAEDGPIVPVYHLNALACSRLAPANATVVDLGCGSGRYAAYLARMRPDLRVVGIDLSAPMVETGNRELAENGLAERVSLRVGDMTAFADSLPADTALVSCVFALHHLPGIPELRQCLGELRGARERTGSGVWLFDLARPRHARTAEDYPLAFTPEAPEVFRLDSTNSLRAAYSFGELVEAVETELGPGALHAVRARLFPLYQAFWSAGRLTASGSEAWPEPGKVELTLSSTAAARYRGLRSILPGLPR